MTSHLYGPETKKALKNFPISGQPININFIHTVTTVKLACIEANLKLKKINKKIYPKIRESLLQIIKGDYDKEFIDKSLLNSPKLANKEGYDKAAIIVENHAKA